MQPDRFVEQRRASWRRLEELITAARGNLRTLSVAELNHLGQLYRAATSDLALAQRDFADHRVTNYLNQLVGSAHATIYRGEPLQRRQIGEFITLRFPQLYRVILPYTTLAFLIFLIPALSAAIIVANAPATIYTLAGAQIAPMVELVEEGKLWTEIEPAMRSSASALTLTNNIRVMFLAFAGGVLGGLLTFWVLFSNGLHLGAVFGLLLAHDGRLALGLTDFIVAHGFIELAVIFIAGGCGLYVGDGILRPGLFSRRETLLQRARLAVTVIMACVPLLIIAGLIEGFISPSGLPFAVKLAVGAGAGLWLHGHLLLSGRNV